MADGDSCKDCPVAKNDLRPQTRVLAPAAKANKNTDRPHNRPAVYDSSIVFPEWHPVKFSTPKSNLNMLDSDSKSHSLVICGTNQGSEIRVGTARAGWETSREVSASVEVGVQHFSKIMNSTFLNRSS